MMLKHGGIVPLLLALAVVQSSAQDTAIDPKEALRQLLSTALSVNIKARVVQPDDTGSEDETPIWNPEITKLTIPGRSIRVRLDGDGVRIYLICTPYLQENGEVLLLAQGQVWLTEPTEKESMYSNIFYTIPVTFGEPILFFPLGLSDEEAQEKDFVNIELEIRPSLLARRMRRASRAPTSSGPTRRSSAASSSSPPSWLRLSWCSSWPAPAWREARRAWSPSHPTAASPVTS